MAPASKAIKGTKAKKAIHRSPNFPALSLEEALNKAEIICGYDGRNLTSTATVLKHLGFAKLTGISGRVIAAMRQFGLLDRSDGKYRITDAAYKILHLSGESEDRWEAIREAAQKPAIYSDLLSTHTDGLPSDTALKDYLIAEKRFNPASVDTFVRAFKETIWFAKLGSGSYNGGADDAGGESGMPDLGAGPSTTKADPNVPIGARRNILTLGEGDAILQAPDTLSAESVQDLEDWVQLVLKRYRRQHTQDS